MGGRQVQTRSPTENPVTPGPNSSISPTPSKPRTTGGSPTIIGWEIPARWYVSAKFTPTALLRRRTWPCPGDPTLISSHTKLSGAPFLWITAAIPMMRSSCCGALLLRGSQLSRANSSAHAELLSIDMLPVTAIDLRMVAAANLVEVAALVGDTARATMLSALMGGRSLTATELACGRLPWASLGLRFRRTYGLEKIGLDIG